MEVSSRLHASAASPQVTLRVDTGYGLMCDILEQEQRYELLSDT
jgi:hypothetical protein